MFNFLFLAGGLLAGFTAGWFMALRYYPPAKKKAVSAVASVASAGEQVKTRQINARKRATMTERKKRILAYLREHGKAKNDDIEELLGVSDATVTNYMDRLEKEGKVVQEGAEKATFYTLK